jgi:hypothetical protein
MAKKKKVEGEIIDTKAIEEKALNYLKTFIEDSERISQYLADNDKEPCWDGHLYLYDGEGKSKEHLQGRVPIQVKGTVVERFKTKKWKFKLERADLQAYLHEPTFFIVCQIKKNSKERKLFYRELLPCTVQKLLKDMGKKESRQTLFHLLPTDLKEFEDKLLVFMNNSRKMLSFANSDPMTMEDVIKDGIRNFSFVSPVKPSDRIQLMNYLSTHDTYLYANISKKPYIDFPIANGPMRFTFKRQEYCDVRIGDRVFYHGFTNEIKDGFMYVTVGGILTMIIPLEEKDRVNASVKIKTDSKYLKESIHEAEFVLALDKHKVLSFGDVDIKLGVNDNNLVEDLHEKLLCWKDLQMVLDKMHVTKPFDLTAITPNQIHLINILIEALVEGKRVKFRKPDNTILLFEIANVKLLSWCIVDKNGECAIGDFFDGAIKISYLYQGKERINASIYSYLQNDNLWSKIDNVDYKGLLPSAIKSVDENAHCLELLNLDVLAMLSAADTLETEDPKKRSTLLEECYKLNDWLLKNDLEGDRLMVHKCNKMQIIKRQRAFDENEVSEMSQILENDEISNIYKVGFCLLLENKDGFNNYYNQLTDDEKQMLKKYPIWRYAKDFGKQSN